MKPEHERSGAARLWQAFLNPSRAQVVVAVLLGVLAFAGVAQVRATGTGDDYAGLRQSDLVQALTGLNAASARSEREIDQLERTRDELNSSTASRAAALAQARKELSGLGVLAGTVPVVGPGVVIEVTLGQEAITINQLIDCIQELRDAGAEAIAMNDTVRVVAQTSFEEGESGIVVDGRELDAPYRIAAIGDPATLDTALNILGGFRDDVEVIGGKVGIDQRKRVSIDVVHTLRQPEFAEPVG